MQKPIDLLIIDTKDEILDTLNKSGLPITMIQYIMKDISTMINSQTDYTIPKLREQYEQSKENNTEENVK